MSSEQGAGGGGNGGGKEQQISAFSVGDLGGALPGGTGTFTAADRAGLVNALKDKLQYLAGQSSGYVESLSPKVKKRVQALQDLQKQHDEVEMKFREERAILEAKYQKLYAPFYAKRFEIVTGAVDVDDNKGEAEAEAKTEEGLAKFLLSRVCSYLVSSLSIVENGVPEFWLTAMKSNEVLGMQITERDEGALKFLKEIKWCNLESPKGFRLDFYFDTNPYFRNSVLSKTYHMVDEDEPILERAIGTEIEWHAGKNLTQKILKKKPKKGAKNTKPVTKTEQCDSFFNFFSPPLVPDDDDDIDATDAEQLQDLMEQDYEIGSTIKEKIIPHAVSWFTGEALQGDEYEDVDDENDTESDDEEEDDEEEEDEEDEEEEDEGSARKPAAPRTKAAVKKQASGDQPPECKQQ
ncbi:nucleosome assembly protein 1;4 isoform X1 [Selaginella moellendorffii]|uniref:nucleosome assembly protein 1;4 isoform X1 n=1 Tax=Selaginella moellendorffii TaxID=88036 RepID=UPI000D1C4FDB|nr:nucleosome assembly protein 1;4 isoform X1 [Selaginella moellendorffii]|eukprot:XP_024527849.1 nucleosome assembly protein 1;4 isoform X1 [Selaginella moellendorffii]